MCCLAFNSNAQKEEQYSTVGLRNPSVDEVEWFFYANQLVRITISNHNPILALATLEHVFITSSFYHYTILPYQNTYPEKEFTIFGEVPIYWRFYLRTSSVSAFLSATARWAPY